VRAIAHPLPQHSNHAAVSLQWALHHDSSHPGP
jgi:hypothetical protein